MTFLDDIAKRVVKQVMLDIEFHKLGEGAEEDDEFHKLGDGTEEDGPQDNTPSEFCIYGATVDDLDGEISYTCLLVHICFKVNCSACAYINDACVFNHTEY